MLGNILAKPFLKWAGGKTKLISDIKKLLPAWVYKDNFTYIEPFVGSGAVLFWFLNNFPNIEKAIINDINEDLINTYKIIATKPRELITNLKILEKDYHHMESSIENKNLYYYQKRDEYNARKEENSLHAALFIFLNRTCFNGLYRVNSKNMFNVPIGDYYKPLICDETNILAANRVLQNVEIICGDFENTINFASDKTLFYFDPPYKPLSKTSNFNSYSRNEFDDKEQIRLKNFCTHLNNLNKTWILSNSDVKGKDSTDNFFDDIYSEFFIKRVNSSRNINANPSKRGKLTELLITNNIENKDYVRAI